MKDKLKVKTDAANIIFDLEHPIVGLLTKFAQNFINVKAWRLALLGARSASAYLLMAIKYDL